MVESSLRLRAVLRALAQSTFSNGDANLYQPIIGSIYNGDWFMVGSDFDAYTQTQKKLSLLWKQQEDWTKHAIHNSIHMGWFSSDRTIREYAREIWNVPVNWPAN